LLIRKPIVKLAATGRNDYLTRLTTSSTSHPQRLDFDHSASPAKSAQFKLAITKKSESHLVFDNPRGKQFFSAKEWTMSKFAFWLFLPVTCCLGCRNVAQTEVKEAHSVSGTKALPTTSWQPVFAKFTPEAVPAKKGDFCQPVGQAEKRVSNSVKGDKYQAANVENQSKPAGALQKDEIEKGISTNQSPGLPKDVWYAIATVFGAVFTYILAPIVVEVFRGRIAKYHADQTQDHFRPAAKGQPS
jgi:hypothetical protein